HQTSHQTSIPGWVFLNYAITQENLKNYQDAIQIYENYLQTFPPLAFPYFRLGTLYAQIGVWNQAKLYLEKAIKCNGNYAEAYHNLGWVLMNIKNQDGEIENSREMLSAYSQAIKLYTLSATSQSLQIAANIKQAFQLIGVNI
ncbi:MAG: tetratricopeptide repeat protein, partial [Sphaerospermopsis kisseleviana]